MLWSSSSLKKIPGNRFVDVIQVIDYVDVVQSDARERERDEK